MGNAHHSYLNILILDQCLREHKKINYPILWDGHTSTGSVQVLPVLVLLAGKMPALQEIFGDFLNWKSLNEIATPIILHLTKF